MSCSTGEMERHSGSVKMGGSLAYVAQQAWIVNDSLQSNVLFGHELDEQRWESCVHACSLQQDLEVGRIQFWIFSPVPIWQTTSHMSEFMWSQYSVNALLCTVCCPAARVKQSCDHMATSCISSRNLLCFAGAGMLTDGCIVFTPQWPGPAHVSWEPGH